MYKKVLIICRSVHHNNTLSIAKAIGEELNAEIIKPSEFNSKTISDYDLIGFGSGIYNGKHHQSILNLIDELKAQNHKHTFIFSTSTIPVEAMHKNLKKSLIAKEFQIVGEYYCKGFMNYSFTKHLGGFNKGRPNDKDLEKARDFAKKLMNNNM
ncbi:flavodoxin family protein [Geosporobacter ferrireducens]|uniref:flavodoxin family protein n=1 Tax=Geosporobacter ferrireducens TaxID=1424294 RepID=UPI00139EC559|nr:flavodoxin family protein [Geosporobacter ferrireducens]MTI54836.1 flavodoxin [Geosporobacter ferrireducens]